MTVTLTSSTADAVIFLSPNSWVNDKQKCFTKASTVATNDSSLSLHNKHVQYSKNNTDKEQLKINVRLPQEHKMKQ